MTERTKFWSERTLRVNSDNVSEVMKSRIVSLVPRIEFGRVGQDQETLGMIKRFAGAVVAGDLVRLKILREDFKIKKYKKYRNAKIFFIFHIPPYHNSPHFIDSLYFCLKILLK